MELHIETEINAPAEKVWEILAHQFGDMADWTTTLSESRVVDASKYPELKAAPTAPVPARETTSSFAKAVEIITKYSEEKMQLTFDAVGLPPFMSSARNTQRVIAEGPDKSVISFDFRIGLKHIFNIMSPLLKRRFNKTMGGVQRELKFYAETGKFE
ncbi:MAG: SRPBCC family protein [Chloroflexi bacterium]|nr:SRPBCC family protein [Chloroflexota bacterium]